MAIFKEVTKIPQPINFRIRVLTQGQKQYLELGRQIRQRSEGRGPLGPTVL